MQPGQSLADILPQFTGAGSIVPAKSIGLVLVQGDTTTAFAGSSGSVYKKKFLWGMWKLDYELDLFNPFPEGSQPAADFPNELPAFALATLAENLQRSGVVGEIHQTSNTVIDALLSVAKRPAISTV